LIYTSITIPLRLLSNQVTFDLCLYSYEHWPSVRAILLSLRWQVNALSIFKVKYQILINNVVFETRSIDIAIRYVTKIVTSIDMSLTTSHQF
jgi:hypothetical protein